MWQMAEEAELPATNIFIRVLFAILLSPAQFFKMVGGIEMAHATFSVSGSVSISLSVLVYI